MFALARRSCLRLARTRVLATGPGPGPVLPASALWRPALFACGFSGTAFAASAIWTYENYWDRTRKAKQRFRKTVQQFTDAQIVAGAITAVNVAVFACSRAKGLRTVMDRYFLLTALKNQPVCLPMVLSTFMHKDIFHLSINMFVMFSFAQSAVSVLGKEQFLAIYTSAGVFASLVSLAHKVARGSTVPTVGASGAILAIFAIHCLLYPDSRIQIVFLPFLGTTAGYALPGVIAMDLAGVLFKWRWLDHAAHLGGASVGSLYYFGGEKLYQQYGSAVARSWHGLTSR